MSKKEKCKAAMTKLFGPAAGNLVDSMSEEECVAKCRQKVQGMLGAARASEFDKMVS